MNPIQSRLRINYQWSIVGLTFIASMGFSLIHQGMPVLFPFMQEEFGATRAELGLIPAMMLAGGTGPILFIGGLVDKIGARGLMTGMLLGLAFLVFVFSLIQSVFAGIILGLLIGVITAGSLPASAKAIMDWVSPGTRSLSMGIMETNVPISGIIGAAFVTTIAMAFGWRFSVIGFSVIIAITGIIFYYLYRDKKDTDPDQKKINLIKSIPLLIRNRAIWLVALSGITLSALQWVFMSYLILFLRDDFGMSVGKAATFLAISHCGSAVGRITWGLASDIWGGQRAKVLFLIGCISAFTMVALIWIPSDISQVIMGILIFIAAATTMGWHGVQHVLIAELAGPQQTGTVIAYVSIIRRLGGFWFLPLFGYIVDKTGSYDPSWLMMAVLAGIGAILILFVKTPQKHLS